MVIFSFFIVRSSGNPGYNPFLTAILFNSPIIIILGNTFPERLLPPVKTAPPEVRYLRIVFLRQTVARRMWVAGTTLFSDE